MLTHVHLLVYTLWCWHTLRRRWSLNGRDKMGFWENEVHIFYCAGGKFGEVTGETLTGRSARRHRTLAFSVWCAVGCSRVHRTHQRESGAQRPVCGHFGDLLCAWVRWAPDAKGASGGSRPVTLRVCWALCARVRCAPDASGAQQVTVRLWHAADVGAPDAGVERPVPL